MIADKRIDSLDILRGLALLGMFVVHFHERSTEPGGLDDVVRTLIWRLVESKSHGTFALLFGAGFALQLRRAGQRGHSFGLFYLRRLAVLAIFGFAAHALFGFNVLLGYAVWGVPLLMMRKWSTRLLLVTAFVSAVSVPLYHLAATQYLSASGGSDAATNANHARQEAAADVNGAVKAAEGQASYKALLAARLSHMAWFYTQPFFLMPGATLALFIVGLLLVRHGVFDEPLAHLRVLAVIGAFGVSSWLAGNWLLPRLGLDPLLFIFRDQWLTFAYVAGALYLLARVPSLTSRLPFIASAGRMALTNYVVQIAALDMLFSGYALSLGTIRPVVGLAVAVTCFAAEALFSRVWLNHFRFGPAEWLWRSLTYGRIL